MSRVSSLSSPPVIFRVFSLLAQVQKALDVKACNALLLKAQLEWPCGKWEMGGAIPLMLIPSVEPVFMVFHTSVDRSENPTGFLR